MQISPLIRKSFPAEGVQVTKENFLDVAEWCGGVVKSREGVAYIKVDVIRPINERQTEAVIGDWVIKVGHGFKVFTIESFDRSFEVLPVKEPDQPIVDLVIDLPNDAGLQEIVETEYQRKLREYPPGIVRGW